MNIDNKIKVMCSKLNEQRKRKIFDIENIEYVKTDGYKKDNNFPEKGWQPFEKGQLLFGKDMHYWLKTEFRTPDICETKYLVYKTTTGFEGEWDAINPQGLLYLNGYMVQGLDTNHTEALLHKNTDYVAHNYFYVGMIDENVNLDMSVWEYDKRVEQLFYDLKPLTMFAVF